MLDAEHTVAHTIDTIDLEALDDAAFEAAIVREAATQHFPIDEVLAAWVHRHGGVCPCCHGRFQGISEEGCCPACDARLHLTLGRTGRGIAAWYVGAVLLGIMAGGSLVPLTAILYIMWLWLTGPALVGVDRELLPMLVVVLFLGAVFVLWIRLRRRIERQRSLVAWLLACLASGPLVSVIVMSL